MARHTPFIPPLDSPSPVVIPSSPQTLDPYSHSHHSQVYGGQGYGGAQGQGGQGQGQGHGRSRSQSFHRSTSSGSGFGAGFGPPSGGGGGFGGGGGGGGYFGPQSGGGGGFGGGSGNASPNYPPIPLKPGGFSSDYVGYPGPSPFVPPVTLAPSPAHSRGHSPSHSQGHSQGQGQGQQAPAMHSRSHSYSSYQQQQQQGHSNPSTPWSTSSSSQSLQPPPVIPTQPPQSQSQSQPAPPVVPPGATWVSTPWGLVNTPLPSAPAALGGGGGPVPAWANPAITGGQPIGGAGRGGPAPAAAPPQSYAPMMGMAPMMNPMMGMNPMMNPMMGMGMGMGMGMYTPFQSAPLLPPAGSGWPGAPAPAAAPPAAAQDPWMMMQNLNLGGMPGAFPGPAAPVVPGAGLGGREPPAHLQMFDRLDKFLPGASYGPVLEPMQVQILGIVPTINPLLIPSSSEEGKDAPHLIWNMLFPPSTIHRSDDPPSHQASWSPSGGRTQPATHPRLSTLHLVSPHIPHLVAVHASSKDEGVTCGDVIDAWSKSLWIVAGKNEYALLKKEVQKEVAGAYHFNRSRSPSVPGGTMGEGMKRVDFLGKNVMWGGLEVDRESVKKVMGTRLVGVFVVTSHSNA